MAEYRVNLDVYDGPLDLLLYLIRRDELDIYDIPIARITEQYVAYMNVLKRLDPNLAGEFLVMAATLMEIKTRMLLPTLPPGEEDTEGAAIDPRAELVRQLLEYKAFKDAAGDLRAAGDRQALRYPRQPHTGRMAAAPDGDEAAIRPAGEFDLEEVQVWDLLDAFHRIMSAIGQDRLEQAVIYDDTPVELHATDILDRLQREGPLTFERVFEGRSGRGEIVGLFLALLELVRRQKVLAVQGRNFDQIRLRLNPNPPAGARGDGEGDEAPAPATGAESAVHTGPAPEPAPEPAPGAEGRYVSDAPAPRPPDAEDDDDDSGAEALGSGA